MVVRIKLDNVGKVTAVVIMLSRPGLMWTQICQRTDVSPLA